MTENEKMNGMTGYTVWVAKCGCGKEEVISYQVGHSNKLASISELERRGWTIHNNGYGRCYCPECSKELKEKKQSHL